MTVLHLNKMLQTPFGRIINFMLIIAILNLSSCTTYKPAETNIAQLRSTEQVTAHLDVYKFFVHDTYNSYQLINPSFNEDGSISGNLLLTAYKTPDSTWNKKDRKAYWKEHKYDINIFTETVLSVLSADLSSKAGTEAVTITPAMIDKMTITSIDMERQASDAGIIVFGVLGLIVVAVLVILLFNAADGGGGDGGGSGSGSGSD